MRFVISGAPDKGCGGARPPLQKFCRQTVFAVTGMQKGGKSRHPAEIAFSGL
jgi:hypothetical protein